MDQEKNVYKYLSIGLGLAVLVLGWMLFAQSNPSVSDSVDSLEDAQEKLTECRGLLAAWSEEHTNDTGSAAAQAELNGILEQCSDDLGQ